MRVAVFGAGYAGVAVARRLERSLPGDVELVVVDEDGGHLLQHELHRVLRRPGFADDLTVPLESLLDRAAVRRGRVVDVDPGAGRATLEDGELRYDFGAVCLGAATDFHGLPGVAEHATPFKAVADARRVRSAFLDAGGRFVVGGAGLSGVQVAGELVALADEEGVDAEVVLLERLDDVAPGFRSDFRSAVRGELVARGVDVRTGVAVEGADAERIEVGGGSIDYDGFVWTGGIRGPDALSGERPTVRGTLRLEGGTFVVGDAARAVDRDGEAVPASAQAAVAEARTAATNIARLVEHERDGGTFEPRLDVVSFSPAGWVVSVGDGAVAQVGPTVFRGRAARALKASVDARYLVSVGAVREVASRVRDEFRP